MSQLVPSPSRSPSSRLWPRRCLWLLVPLVGLVELALHSYFAGRAPSLEQWRALEPVVAELRRERDLLVIAPRWAEPLARHAFPAEWLPLADIARSSAATYPRAIEISILSQKSDELSQWKLEAERSVGRFRIRTLENPAPVEPSFRFVEQLESASVSILSADRRRTPCPFRPAARSLTGGLHGHVAFPKRRFQCPGGLPFLVGVSMIDDERYRARRCILAHPPGDGLLRIAFAEVPLRNELRGFAGLSYFLMREGGGTPVRFEALVDGRSVGRVVHHDAWGFREFAFSTREFAGRRAEVELLISSDRADQRRFCFYLDAR